MSGARAGVVVGLLAAGCAAGSTARPHAPPATPAPSVDAPRPYVLPAAELERAFGGAASVAALRSCVAVEVRRDVGGFGVHGHVEGNVFGFLPEPTGARVERGPLLDAVVARLLDGASYLMPLWERHRQIEYVDIALRFDGPDGERLDVLHAIDIAEDEHGWPCFVLSHGGTLRGGPELHHALRALEAEAARRAGWTTRRP